VTTCLGPFASNSSISSSPLCQLPTPAPCTFSSIFQKLHIPTPFMQPVKLLQPALQMHPRKPFPHPALSKESIACMGRRTQVIHEVHPDAHLYCYSALGGAKWTRKRWAGGVPVAAVVPAVPVVDNTAALFAVAGLACRGFTHLGHKGGQHKSSSTNQESTNWDGIMELDE